MEPKIALAYAEISFISQATEDPEKILRGLEERLSLTPDLFQKTEAKGYFGNPIAIYKALLKTKRAESLIKSILQKNELNVCEQMIQDMREFVDERGNLYLRLDKQALAKGSITFAIRGGVMLKTRPKFVSMSMDVVAYYQLLLREMLG